VAERGEASARVGSGGAEAGMARGTVLSGTEPAVTAHMARLRRRRHAAEEKQRRERRRSMKGDLIAKIEKHRDSTVKHR
jgi:hypothetical protein